MTPRVRLTRKFAEFIDGIDLRHVKAGDVMDLSPEQVRVLIAEGWATLAPPDQPPTKLHKRATKTKRAAKKR